MTVSILVSPILSPSVTPGPEKFLPKVIVVQPLAENVYKIANAIEKDRTRLEIVDQHLVICDR